MAAGRGTFLIVGEIFKWISLIIDWWIQYEWRRNRCQVIGQVFQQKEDDKLDRAARDLSMASPWQRFYGNQYKTIEQRSNCHSMYIYIYFFLALVSCHMLCMNSMTRSSLNQLCNGHGPALLFEGIGWQWRVWTGRNMQIVGRLLRRVKLSQLTVFRCRSIR